MKRVFCVEVISFFGNTDQILEFHYVMFHGLAHRQVPIEHKHTPREWGHTGYGPILPLSIIRPGTFFPMLCQPDKNLVVREELALSLEQVPNVELVPVDFEKLFEIRYAKGDMWWYEQGRAPLDPTRFAREVNDQREKFSAIPKCYEVLSTRLLDVESVYREQRSVRCKVVNKMYEWCAEFAISDAMCSDHPILWNGGLTILSEPIFSILEPHLDRDFFSVSEATLV